MAVDKAAQVEVSVLPMGLSIRKLGKAGSRSSRGDGGEVE
jgi:hypothetical protein